MPGRKKVIRYLDENGRFYGDGIVLAAEVEKDVETIYHPYYPAKHSTVTGFEKEPLLHKVMNDGSLTIDLPEAEESAGYARRRLEQLNAEHKRFDNPHIYKVGLSKKLMDLRDQLTKTVKSQDH